MSQYGYSRPAGNQRFNDRNRTETRPQAKKPHQSLTEENYVAFAEEAILDLVEKSRTPQGKVNMVTTSKIRNLLSMTADIYNDVIASMEETLDADVTGRIAYLRVRFVYEVGRDPKQVKNFVDSAQILDHLNDIGNSRKKYILFSRYMEALIAFHKYYGGRED